MCGGSGCVYFAGMQPFRNAVYVGMKAASKFVSAKILGNSLMTYRLFDFAPSPFCLKVRAIFDYKKIPYERINVMGMSWFQFKRRSPTGKVPALEVEGRLICDSTDIAYFLEERHPSPSIIPSDPEQRARCHLLEDWADDAFYWQGFYHRWRDAEGRAGAARAFPFLVRGLLTRRVEAMALRQLDAQGIGRKDPTVVARDLDRSLTHLDALLGDEPFFVAATPQLCDFAVNAQLVYLDRTPKGHRAITHSARLVAFIERMRALREATSPH